MTSFTRSGWLRAKSSLTSNIGAILAERETEVLRQLTDVFKEIERLTSQAHELARRVEELTDTVSVLADVENQSTELLGRLLAQARARLDAIEEAGQKA